MIKALYSKLEPLKMGYINLSSQKKQRTLLSQSINILLGSLIRPSPICLQQAILSICKSLHLKISLAILQITMQSPSFLLVTFCWGLGYTLSNYYCLTNGFPTFLPYIRPMSLSQVNSTTLDWHALDNVFPESNN